MFHRLEVIETLKNAEEWVGVCTHVRDIAAINHILHAKFPSFNSPKLKEKSLSNIIKMTSRMFALCVKC